MPSAVMKQRLFSQPLSLPWVECAPEIRQRQFCVRSGRRAIYGIMHMTEATIICHAHNPGVFTPFVDPAYSCAIVFVAGSRFL